MGPVTTAGTGTETGTGPLQPLLSEVAPEGVRPLSLLDNEADSDVEFVVGPDGDTWRLPGHRRVLALASPVFKAMLTGPLAAPPDHPIRITDVDGRAFHQLLKVLYGVEPDIRSERTCLQTLYCANKYLCPALAMHCVEKLDAWLDESSVLRFLHAIWQYVPAGMDCNEPFAPSAPPALDSPERTCPQELAPSPAPAPMTSPAPVPVPGPAFPDPSLDSNMGWYCGALLYNCLQFIDAHTDQVLESEFLEDLTQEELVHVVSRDSLALRREEHLFAALDRWADSECKRTGLRLSADNKRAVLGEAVYAVRYLRMDTEELLDGPVRSGLLRGDESACLLGAATGQPQPVPEHLRPHMRWFAEPRPSPDPTYLHLSARSSAEVDLMQGSYEKATETEFRDPRQLKKEVKALKKLAKKKKREEQRKSRGHSSDEQDRKSRCSGTCFAEVFFSILACIFD